MLIRKLQTLSTFNFVHLITEPRSGSGALFSRLQMYKKPELINWSKMFNEPINVNRIDPYELCASIENPSSKIRLMKNHLKDLLVLPIDLQQRYFNLPGIKIGLSRRSIFEQTCSVLIAKKSTVWNGNQHVGQQYFFDSFEFFRTLKEIVDIKLEMSNHLDLLDMLLFMEDLDLPSTMPTKNLPKKQHISNIDQLQEWYQIWIHDNMHILKNISFLQELDVYK